LVDEASRLNVNTATLEMLEALPNMTTELAAAIIDWRDSDSDADSGGAETDVYQRLNPPYRCKNADYESIEELRLVYGMTLDFLYGEDTNLNGAVDPNESDGDLTPPYDNRDGWLDAGLLNYVTIYSREPNTRTNGEARIDVTSTNQQELATLLQEQFGADRANEILRQVAPSQGGGPQGGGGGGGASSSVKSLLEFFIRSGMTEDEFAQIEGDLAVTSTNSVAGLVNVNTASEAVLACIPGIGTEFASTLVAQRQSVQAGLTYLPTVAWVADVLEETNCITAGPYLTSRSYQFTADIAAVGHFGRGYRRVKHVFDTSEGVPTILYRQDLTHLGWALGQEVRNAILLAKEKR
jgi:hypothetical protein